MNVTRIMLALAISMITLSANESTLSDLSVKDLVERLAISQEPAADRIVYTPSVDTPDDDKRVIAFDAAKELENRGVAAFPQLIASFNDRRQSVAFIAAIPHTVGLACYCIIQDQIESPPYYYQRKGSDGEYHERPEFLPMNKVENWWRERSDKKLIDLQLEALRWRITAEKSIGFEDATQRLNLIVPLESRLKELEDINSEANKPALATPDPP